MKLNVKQLTNKTPLKDFDQPSPIDVCAYWAHIPMIWCA